MGEVDDFLFARVVRLARIRSFFLAIRITGVPTSPARAEGVHGRGD